MIVRSQLLMAASALAIVGALSVGANAAPAQSWTGFYAGFGVGGSFGSNDVNFMKLKDATTTVEDKSGTTAVSGSAFTVEGGYDFQSGPMVFGFAGNFDFTLGNMDSSFVKDKDHTVTESISNTWGLGGRAGMLINDNTLLFGAAGVAGATLHVAMTPGGDEDPIDESGSLTGYYIGAGLETLLKNGWSLKGEYRYSGYSGGFDTADYKNKDGEEKWLNIGNLVTQSVRLTLDRRF